MRWQVQNAECEGLALRCTRWMDRQSEFQMLNSRWVLAHGVQADDTDLESRQAPIFSLNKNNRSPTAGSTPRASFSNLPTGNLQKLVRRLKMTRKFPPSFPPGAYSQSHFDPENFNDDDTAAGHYQNRIWFDPVEQCVSASSGSSHNGRHALRFSSWTLCYERGSRYSLICHRMGACPSGAVYQSGRKLQPTCYSWRSHVRCWRREPL